jgi:hypothetical protein
MADCETAPTLLGIEAVIGFLIDPESYFDGTAGEGIQNGVGDFGAPLWEILEGQEEWWGEYNSYESPIML